MKSEILEVVGSWRAVADSARTTIHKEAGEGEPSSSWKRRMLIAEHSPIRQLMIRNKWDNIKYYVSVHFTRHFIGIIHFVRTQRTDRTGIERDELPQGAELEHEFIANAQSIISISRKRLCKQALKETRFAWTQFLNQLEKVEPELRSVCVRECVYRGFCPEFKSCNYHKTDKFQEELEEYRRGINEI